MSDGLNNAQAWQDSIRKCGDPEIAATLKELRHLSVPPADADAYNTWLEADDAMRFLAENAKSDWVVVYSALLRPHTLLIHGVLVPRADISPPNIDDLLRWNYNPFCSWSWVSDGSEKQIDPPLAMSGSKTMKEGEQLVLGRTDFADNSYFEIAQRFAHVSNLHYVEEQSSWCIKGKRGDIEPAVYLATDSVGHAVLFRRDVLSDYASLTDAAMVRMFDFPRRNDSFMGWGSTLEERKDINRQKIYARRLVTPSYASYHKGVQISDIAASSKDAVDNDKKHVPFATLDMDILQELKQTLRDLQCEWWNMPPESVLERLNYPHTKSRDDWSKEIKELSDVLIERLVEKALRSKAQKLGQKQNDLEELRTLQLLEQCLIGCGFASDQKDANGLITPLYLVKNIRDKFSHRRGEDAEKLEKEAINVHGNLLNHYKYLVDGCNRVFQTLADQLK